MNKKEFEKLNYCLELLAVVELISNEKKLSKKKLLDRKVFDCYYQEEFDKFIELAEERKDLLKEIIKNLTELNYTAAIKFAKENKENYIRLYNLHYVNNHNSILCYIRGIYDQYLDKVERLFKKEAKEIFESLVSE